MYVSWRFFDPIVLPMVWSAVGAPAAESAWLI